MRRQHPSDLLIKSRHPASRRTTQGVHVFDTEVRTLEQACDLIAEKNAEAKRVRTCKRLGHPTLRQELALAVGQSMAKKISLPGGRSWRNPKMVTPRKISSPHPFRDHPNKPAKVREMLESGYWGFGVPAYRRLARLFGVTLGQIVSWAGDV